MKSNVRLYVVFIVAFFVMHFTSQLLSGLPYIILAIIVCAAVLTVIILSDKISTGRSVQSTIRDIGLRKTNLQGIAPGIFVSLALLCSYFILAQLLDTRITFAKQWLLHLTGLVFTAGIAEEVLFRGFLFGSLRRKMSFGKAVLLSGICFTIAHLLMFTYMDWAVALMSTLLAIATSLPLAYLFEKGNHSIWSPAIVHITIRTIGLVITVEENQFMTFSLWWMFVCMILPYIVLMFYKDFR